jgi:hypothetical protein
MFITSSRTAVTQAVERAATRSHERRCWPVTDVTCWRQPTAGTCCHLYTLDEVIVRFTKCQGVTSCVVAGVEVDQSLVVR